MRTLILIFLIVILVACESVRPVSKINKTTNYFPITINNKALVLREVAVDVDSLKNLLVVDEYFVEMGNNLEFFKAVKTEEQFFSEISRSSLAKKIPNFTSNEGLYNLAQIYPSFVILYFSSDKKPNGDVSTVLSLYYPKLGNIVFQSEIDVNLREDNKQEQAALNQLFNSLLDYLRKQTKAQGFLKNDGILTYFDKLYESNFAVSFIGDSVMNVPNFNSIYMIDMKSMVQFTKYPIPYDMKDFMFDSIKEYKLLERMRDYEFDYIQEKSFKQKIECHTEYFTNQYSKRFLIWYYKEPDSIPNQKKSWREEVDKERGEPIATYEADYQLYLMFTSNNCVVMINYPVFKQENLSFRLDYLKNEVANSVRVFNMNMDAGFLNKQIEHNINKKPLIVKDTFVGIQYEVPYWLNVYEQPPWLKNFNENKYSLFGTFPDIDNISNALVLTYLNKSRYSSYKEFIDSSTIYEKDVVNFEKISGTEERFDRFKIYSKTKEGYEFTNQYVLFEVGNYYGTIYFTATPGTYDKNVNRFNEFLKSVKFLK